MGYLLPSVALSTQKKVFLAGRRSEEPVVTLSFFESVATKRGDKYVAATF